MSDESVQVSFYIPPELHRLVGADSRDNSDVAKVALWREFGGEKKGALEQRIDEIEDREDMIQKEIDNRESELEELDKEKQNYLEKIDKLENGFIEDEDYEQARELLDSGERLYDTHEFVDGLAEKYEPSQQDVHEELKEELDYPDVAFRLKDPHGNEPFDWRRVEGGG